MPVPPPPPPDVFAMSSDERPAYLLNAYSTLKLPAIRTSRVPLATLLRPRSHPEKTILMLTQLSIGDIADTLRAHKYDAHRVHTSSCGLRHSFVIVKCAGHIVVVDPEYRDQFNIPFGSDEYNATLESIPEIVVANYDYMYRATATLGAMLVDQFAKANAPVPPWRTQRCTLERWKLCPTITQAG